MIKLFLFVGTLQARTAIANEYNTPEAPLAPSDIILANGCSGALEMCVNVLCNEGSNILIPRPGFSLYASLAATRFVETKYYNLLVSVFFFIFFFSVSVNLYISRVA